MTKRNKVRFNRLRNDMGRLLDETDNFRTRVLEVEAFNEAMWTKPRSARTVRIELELEAGNDTIQ